MSHPIAEASPPAAQPDLAVEFLDRRTPLDRARQALHRYPALSPGIVIILAVIVFGLLNPRFFYANNLSLVSQQVAVVGTLAIAQTLVILTAGIDLGIRITDRYFGRDWAHQVAEHLEYQGTGWMV